MCRDCVGLDTDEESNALSKGGDMWIGKGVKGEHWDQNFTMVYMLMFYIYIHICICTVL